ncbi:DUF1127 domain-containing protein [Paracoccus binzhouensis]|uniref:DUF1127 domain-containing protein n=1 Tax=Paracoccus binzhouensis TaxID=2796149 RepID=UPI001E52FF95|nr:DUF1127 domain-containing protein [Paracoccus binzhouensis]
MTILKDVLAELVGMFIGDARLSAAILAVVAVAVALIDLAQVEPLIGGGVLLVGSLAVVPIAARLAARPKATSVATTDGTPGHPEAAGTEHRLVVMRRDGLLGRAAMWFRRLHQRRSLKELDDRLLDDIGVSREAAETESRRLD